MGNPVPRKATEAEGLLALEQGLGQIATELGGVKNTMELARASRIFSEATFSQFYERLCKLYDDTCLLVTEVADKETKASINPPAIIHPTNHHKR